MNRDIYISQGENHPVGEEDEEHSISPIAVRHKLTEMNPTL